MTDESIMPFGKYKGDPIGAVPAAYLLWLYEENKCYGDPITHTVVRDTPPNDFCIWKPSQVTQINGMVKLANDLNYIAPPSEPKIKAGMITTFKSHVPLYGYFEVSMKVAPKGWENYSGIWLCGLSWDGEIDVAEFMNEDSFSYKATIHKRVNGDMQQRSQGNIVSPVDLSNSFHVYACDWQKDYVRIYLDNKLVHEYLGPYIPDIPMYLILQIGVKNNYNPETGTQTFPNFCLIDYVQIWKKL